MKTETQNICTCGHNKKMHCDDIPTGKPHCHGAGHTKHMIGYKCPCKKFTPQKKQEEIRE